MEEVDLDFKKLTLDCVDALRPYFINNECRICDCTVGGTFIWRDYHKTEYAVEGDCLYIKVGYPTPAFAPPRVAGAALLFMNDNKHSPNFAGRYNSASEMAPASGNIPVSGDIPVSGRVREAYERIIEYCASKRETARLCSVSETVLESVLRMYPGSKVWTNRDWSDYLYLSEELVNLNGRKFAGQRNHINRFSREYPTWSFDDITSGNISEVRDYVEKFAREFDKDSSVYMEGNRKALEVLDNLGLFRQFGGALSVAGKIVGVSIGEATNDTLYIHAEKADTAYYGSYPMLMNQFAKRFATVGINYINREEDDGVEGLRISKTSYHPVELLNKYMVELG